MIFLKLLYQIAIPIIFCISLFTSVVTIYSAFSKSSVPPRNRATPQAWETFDEKLAYEITSRTSLKNEIETRIRSSGTKSPSEQMQIAYDVVNSIFSHGLAEYSFQTNWINWLLGKLHPVFGVIQTSESLLRYSTKGFCSQSSLVLLDAARMLGLPTRHVGLNGHVVMEAWFDNDWHMYDVDLEVVPYDKHGNIASVEQVAQSPELLKKYYSDPLREKAGRAIASREDNTFVSFPEGAQFEWKTEFLAQFELLTLKLKILIPAAITLTILLKNTRFRPRQKEA